MMYNKNFLLQLDKDTKKQIYAKITALTLQELPIESIEGRVAQGSINIDGASAVRRTCSLTLVAQDFDYSNYLWGLNTKFKLEIGVENNIDKNYPDIIWFKQGIYFISSFNTSRSTNNFSISIQGKDKMCMLSGDVGGKINSPVDFGTIEEEDVNGNWRIRKIPIREIITNMVHQYGGEPLHNIIINDLPEYGLELLEYRYDVPMYLYRISNRNSQGELIGNSNYVNATLDGSIKCVVDNGTNTTLSDLQPTDFDMLVDPLMGDSQPKDIKIDDVNYIFAKVEYGQTAGYRQTPLVYAGDLLANIGESITSVLDKIKNMLGEFEYFYDLDGRFVFQKKQSFVNTIYSPMEGGEYQERQEITNYTNAQLSQYTFTRGELVTTFNNNPNIANVKNDYSIWGERTSLSGAKVPIHLRYAIDKKPLVYVSIIVTKDEVADYNKEHGTTLSEQLLQKYYVAATNRHDSIWEGQMIFCDWREVIYQMALDYYKYGHLDDFESKVAAANSEWYPFGITGYEQYYTDLQGFWRQLYDPTSQDNDNYYLDENNEHFGWNKNVYKHPEALNFWFDFLDTEGELSQFSVKSIGCRPIAINDTNIKSIYFRKTPNVLFVEEIPNSGAGDNGYKYIQTPGINTMFSISAQGKSAKSKLDELIYQYGYCSESATINCVPIYYLQPNTIVSLFDEDTHLNGEYVLNKITIPLAYNGTMSLTLNRAAKDYLH